MYQYECIRYTTLFKLLKVSKVTCTVGVLWSISPGAIAVDRQTGFTQVLYKK